jgi:G:T-mismatch repair DNA endonuclease (very short patch repair protein)
MAALAARGWRSIVVWECETGALQLNVLTRKIAAMLGLSAQR